jgi:hypothetical protein
MKIVEIVGVGKLTTVIGSEVEPVSLSVGVMGVEEGPKGELFEGAPIAPESLVGAVFGGTPIVPVSLVGAVLGGAPIAPVSLVYSFKERSKSSEEEGWKGEALGLRQLLMGEFLEGAPIAPLSLAGEFTRSPREASGLRQLAL